jgi:hypothetical protein
MRDWDHSLLAAVRLSSAFCGKRWKKSLDSMIQTLNVFHYPLGSGNYTTESFVDPSCTTVFAELKSIHPHEFPIMTLIKFSDASDGELLLVTGGDDAFHIQIADSDAKWFQAVDMDGADVIVDVGTSDQGYSCEYRLTCPLETTSKIVKHFFGTGQLHPNLL